MAYPDIWVHIFAQEWNGMTKEKWNTDVGKASEALIEEWMKVFNKQIILSVKKKHNWDKNFSTFLADKI